MMDDDDDDDDHEVRGYLCIVGRACVYQASILADMPRPWISWAKAKDFIIFQQLCILVIANLETNLNPYTHLSCITQSLLPPATGPANKAPQTTTLAVKPLSPASISRAHPTDPTRHQSPSQTGC